MLDVGFHCERNQTVDPLYDYETAASLLGISERTLRKTVAARRIRFARIGRAVKFTGAMLAEFVDASTVKPATARKAA